MRATRCRYVNEEAVITVNSDDFDAETDDDSDDDTPQNNECKQQ
jgi:hypothetical protein